MNIKKILLIRAISLWFSISIALPSTAYSLPENYSNILRVPLNTQEFRERQKEAQSAAVKGVFFSIHNLRPGWTFKGWGGAKKVIYKRFTSTSERKEALKLIRKLAIRLADKGIGSFYALRYGIPAIAKAAKNIEELKSFIDLAIRLADKKIYPGYTLRYGIPAIAKAANNIAELKLFIDVAVRLADKGIDPGYALRYGIPVIAKAAKNIHELKETLSYIENTAVRLADKNINSRYTLEYGMPAITKAAKNMAELKLFIDLAVRLADKRVYPGFVLIYSIPVIANAAKTPEELKLFIDFMPNMVSRIEKEAVLKFITAEHIIKATALQGTYGDFKVVYSYTPEAGHNEQKLESTEWVVDQPESCKIQILPPDSTDIKQTKIRKGLRDQV